MGSRFAGRELVELVSITAPKNTGFPMKTKNDLTSLGNLVQTGIGLSTIAPSRVGLVTSDWGDCDVDRYIGDLQSA